MVSYTAKALRISRDLMCWPGGNAPESAWGTNICLKAQPTSMAVSHLPGTDQASCLQSTSQDLDVQLPVLGSGTRPAIASAKSEAELLCDLSSALPSQML